MSHIDRYLATIKNLKKLIKQQNIHQQHIHISLHKENIPTNNLIISTMDKTTPKQMFPGWMRSANINEIQLPFTQVVLRFIVGAILFCNNIF